MRLAWGSRGRENLCEVAEIERALLVVAFRELVSELEGDPKWTREVPCLIFG